MEPPKRLVLDTNVIVDHLRGKGDLALMSLLQEKSELATTMVNAFELFYGAHKSQKVRANLASVKGFLSTVELLELDEVSMEKSGKVLADLEKDGLGIDPRDLFIGCVSASRGYALLTNNRRHLERIEGLLVVTPSDIVGTRSP